MLCIWNKAGNAFEVFHLDFDRIRAGKDSGFFYKENWTSYNRDEAVPYAEFNPDDPKGAQIYAYNEYRPGTNIYPIPEYIACNNYIETDIEISKFHLSSIKNGMMPSKMIQFFNGEPPDEKKKEIERRWQKKFTGSESAGKFILVFNKTKDQEVRIDDLSASELDKQFDILNKTCEQEIFTGHQVTSPMLFGIKSEGQLGGATELKIAYEIFINTYAKHKQKTIERVVNYLNGLNNKPTGLYLQQLDPVGVQIDIGQVINILPKEYIFEKLNVPKDYWQAPSGVVAPVTGEPQAEVMVNDAINKLTAKQHQQLLRIIRQYTKGQITFEIAKTLMRTGYGLTAEDIDAMLGLTGEQEFAAEYNEDEIISLFNAFGEDKGDYHLVSSKRVDFSVDEAFSKEQAFATDVSISEADILSLINKDKRVTPEVIAETLKVTPEYVTAKIAALVKRGLISAKTETIGSDKITERQLTKPLKDITADLTDQPINIFIRYSYEGPQDSRNRPFCARLMKLNRYYSRSEIEQISQRLGYSVWDRRGGWWRHPDGEITPYCRHRWESHVVVKKGAAK